MDLDLWDCFGRKKTLFYNQRNMVTLTSLYFFFLKKANLAVPVFFSLVILCLIYILAFIFFVPNYVESTEIKTPEYFCIPFEKETAKLYPCRNNPLYSKKEPLNYFFTIISGPLQYYVKLLLPECQTLKTLNRSSTSSRSGSTLFAQGQLCK